MCFIWRIYFGFSILTPWCNIQKIFEKLLFLANTKLPIATVRQSGARQRQKLECKPDLPVTNFPCDFSFSKTSS
jgi:hypothetical protein